MRIVTNQLVGFSRFNWFRSCRRDWKTTFFPEICDYKCRTVGWRDCVVSETGDDSHLAVGFWHPCIFVFCSHLQLQVIYSHLPATTGILRPKPCRTTDTPIPTPAGPHGQRGFKKEPQIEKLVHSIQ